MKYKKSAKTFFLASLHVVGKAIDIVVFMCLAVLTISLFLMGNTNRVKITVLLSFAVFLLTVFAEYTRSRILKKKRYQQVRNEILIEKVLLLSNKELGKYLHVSKFQFIRKKAPEQSEILYALHMHPTLLICMKRTENIERLVKYYEPQVRIVTVRELAESLPFTCSEDEIKQRVDNIDFAHKTANRSRNVLRVTWNRYFLLGTLLLVLSFLFRHKIYYRFLASISLFLSVIKGVFDNKSIRTNCFSFLDIMDR